MATVDDLAAEARALAQGAADRLENHSAQAVQRPPGTCGENRHDQFFWQGFLQGVCALLATATGEQSTDLYNAYRGGNIR